MEFKHSLPFGDKEVQVAILDNHTTKDVFHRNTPETIDAA
jgi:hypothetical protein